MKLEYISPFVASITSVFDTMLDCCLTRGKPFVKNGRGPEYDISGIIGLSGKARGVVVLSFSWDTARNATAAFLQGQPSEIEDDMADAVGELTNMIAGGAKAQLEQYSLTASLPDVVVGKDHAVEFPENVIPVCIPFESELGPVILEVGLAE